MGEVNLENVNYRKKSNGETDYECWIDLSGLPRWESGKNKDGINWSNCIGMVVDLKYKNINETVNILDYNKPLLIVRIRDKEYNIRIGNFKNCGFGSILGEITSDFKIKLDMIFKDEKRDLVIINRGYRRDKKGQNCKWYKYRCNKCGYDKGWMVEHGLLNGNGCACCTNRIVVEGINDIATTAPWMVKYFANPEDAKKYTKSSNKKVNMLCPDCFIMLKNRMISNLYRSRNIGCKRCSDGLSYLSKYLYSVLNQLDIDFQTEVKYKWNKYINPLNNKPTQASIDFVIYHNGREIPLEADGEFHRRDNKMNYQTKEMSEYIDRQRDENCLKYLGEETIRITDEGNIKENILNSKLMELFDLTKIDWNKCEEFAMNNLAKDICKYWNNKEEWETTVHLGEIFNLSTTTVRTYLKKCVHLGWCEYDSKNETEKTLFKKGNPSKLKKKISVYKNNVYMGTFESMKKVDEISEETFGTKMSFKGISDVVRGKQKTHRGFTFKYVGTSKEEII